MINIERLSASLYAKTLNLSGASGGKPEFTVEDWNHLRGRLASRDKLACVIVESIFSEPVAPTAECDAAVKLAQLKQAWRLARAVEIAKLALHIAQNDADDLETSRSRAEVSHAKAELETARAARWQAYSPRYATVRLLVLRELAKAARCKACVGRKHIRVGELVRPCNACNGTGRERQDDATRAEAMGIRKSQFQRDWASAYDWTLSFCSDARSRGLLIARSEIGVEVA